MGGGGYHVYIIIVCEHTGMVWTIGGGPEDGRLVDKSGPGGRNNYEGVAGPAILSGHNMLIKDDDRPGIWWYDKLRGIGQEIQTKELNYWFMDNSVVDGNNNRRRRGRNSNAFVTTVIARGGLADEVAHASPPISVSPGGHGSFYAPGWGNYIPR